MRLVKFNQMGSKAYYSNDPANDLSGSYVSLEDVEDLLVDFMKEMGIESALHYELVAESFIAHKLKEEIDDK